MRKLALAALLLLAAAAVTDALALGQPRYIAFTPQPDGFDLANASGIARLYVDANDWPGVARAVNDLQADLARVTDRTAVVTHDESAPGANIVIVGTIGRSRLIDRLIAEGRIDPAPIAGRWESFLIQPVAAPLPGVAHALVIAGSDKRGTIFGVYDLSEQIGVSPWYWWADVPAEHRDTLAVTTGAHVQGPPSVKYRGIFLNDEAPALTNWVAAKYGSAPRSTNPPVPAGVANYGHEFYARIFEVLLRLKANYLWPAMWNNAFNEDDPDNARLADEFGIVLGTSHQEPMLRAQKEWDRRYQATFGSWNYAAQPDVLQNFWREGVRRNRAYESIVTLGLRGANDTPMAPGGPEANRALLEQIVAVQRDILRDEVNADVTRVPQLWCLYKEVQDFYAAGLRVPDDVTLLWAEDNWGNVRRLPTADERARSGGAGVYYHFDYHGGPRSYQWMNTNPISKIWDQMALARQYGADRIWIVNVGHFKGYEFPLEYFLSLGWDASRWTHDNTGEFTRLWAAREFGPEHAGDIAGLVERSTKFNGRRKPELLAPDTYSLVDYREADRVVADYNALATRAAEISSALPAAKRDAFYQLVLFPAQACALVNELYVTAGKNALYARQGRASTADYAAATRTLFARDLALMDDYNQHFAGGRWAHFMDQTHLGYTTWQDPPTNSLRAIPLSEPPIRADAGLGVAVEGSSSAWPGATGEPALPRFDAFNQPTRYIDVFNLGAAAFAFTATPSAPWIVLNAAAGTIEKEQRLSVSVDWSLVPAGTTAGSVRLAGAGSEVTVRLEAFNPTAITRDTLSGFVEADGVVSIEAAHFVKNTDAGDRRWLEIEDYGRTLSGLRATAAVDAPPATPGTDAPCLEYQMYTFTTGPVTTTAIVGPTLNFAANRPLRYAIAFDDDPPQTITLVPADYSAQNGNADWEKVVSDNARSVSSTHTLASPGYHTLKVWMIDPGVVLEKLVVNLGGQKPSYLGPPESYRHILPASIATAPRSHAVAAGGSTTLTVTAGGTGPFSYQWQKDGVALPGATAATLAFAHFSAADQGDYRVIVTNAAGSATSSAARLSLGHSHVANISVRGQAGTGDQTLILGFVLAGTGTKDLVLRNIGPTLASFGVSGVLPDPELLLFHGSSLVDRNDDWGANPALTPTLFATVGASPLLAGSRDSALRVALPAGSYSVHGRGRDGATGIALLEAYEADAGAADNHLMNFSVRNQVGTGDDILIVGFVVGGNVPLSFLLRGVGPTLAQSGVSGALADPQLVLYTQAGTAVAANDDWDATGPLPARFSQVGAAPLPPGSRDAALEVSVPPGVYAAHVRGANATTGVALLEVYLVE